MGILKPSSRDHFLLPLFLLGSLFLLTSLGNGRLWQDEAETAVLGKNILAFGYPKAMDGVNLLNPGLRFQEGYAWTYHSWLPFYLAAVSFALLGPTTFAARLPFALIGWVTLWLAYRLFRRLSGSRSLARWLLLLLTLSVPFLLHMRQCRYYAPAVFFTLWSVWAYLRFRKDRPWGGIELVAALLFLFHADHGVFAPVFGALGLHFLWNERGQWHRGLCVALSVSALCLPWVIYLQSGQHHHAFSWREIRHHAEFYFRQVNRFLLPIIFWGALIAVWPSFRKKVVRAWKTQDPSLWRMMGCLLGVGFLFLVVIPEQRHFRYLIFLVPFLLFFQAFLFQSLFEHRKKAAMGVMALLLFTDLLHYSLPTLKVRSLLWEYAGELARPYRGPMDGVIELLHAKAREGQTLKIPYEDHTVIFYTQLAVEPVIKPEDFARETFPDWIVIRRDWLPSGFLESPYYARIQHRYEKIVLDAPDIPWQNRPDPGYHRFRTDRQAPPVVAFHKKQ